MALEFFKRGQYSMKTEAPRVSVGAGKHSSKVEVTFALSFDTNEDEY